MEEKFKITRNSITLMGGLCFILLAFVTFFSNNTPFSFLSNVITYVFGFVGYWILLPFIVVVGLFLIFNKKFIKLKIGLSLWGVFVIIISLIILASQWASIGVIYNGITLTGKGYTELDSPKFVTYSTCIQVHKEVKALYGGKVGSSPRLGGGIIGFIFVGALNSALSPKGMNAVCWIMFIGGFCMIFNNRISKAFKQINLKKLLSKEEKTTDYSEVSIGEADEEQETPEVKEEPIVVTKEEQNKPIVESFHINAPINNDYTLKKAHFDDFDVSLSSPKTSEINNVYGEPTKPIFDDFVKTEEPIKEEMIAPEKHVEVIKESIPQEPEIKENSTSVEEPEENNYEENVSTSIPAAPIPEPKPVEVDFLHMPQSRAKLIENYIYPSIDLLDMPVESDGENANEASCIARCEIINKTLQDLHVGAEVVGYTVGPSVTRFDLLTHSDFSVTGIQKYITDISVRLNGELVRFEAIVAGKSTSGLEIPNEIRTNVTIRECVEGISNANKHLLDIPFGKSISGELKFANLADFPHMLVSGTTGSGKSIFIHSTIVSLLMRTKPEEMKLILIDPKKVEMNYYDEIPHLLCPVISDVRKVYTCFQKLVDEMERRYNLFSSNRVRDIKSFNEFAKANGIQPLPFIIVFVDEFADLVESCKEIRDPLQRIVQKARAAGIHIVLATQRPSVNVIDGVVKANFSTRVALMSASATDSQTIIGEGGAEKLLGWGDMLVDCSLISRTMKPRVQGCYVTENEINRICDFLRNHYQTQYDPYFLNLEPKVEEKIVNEPDIKPIDKSLSDDDQYEDIKEQIMHREYCSISYIQRTFAMGFSRAGKIFNRLQKEGIVAPTGDARGCKVLCFVPGEQQMGTIEQSTFIPDENDN